MLVKLELPIFLIFNFKFNQLCYPCPIAVNLPCTFVIDCITNYFVISTITDLVVLVHFLYLYAIAITNRFAHVLSIALTGVVCVCLPMHVPIRFRKMHILLLDNLLRNLRLGIVPHMLNNVFAGNIQLGRQRVGYGFYKFVLEEGSALPMVSTIVGNFRLFELKDYFLHYSFECWCQ